MDYEEALRNLEGRGFGIRADLGRIRALCDLLDNPQRGYPTIHVAGTNGKSTTARMVGAILAAHGLKAGVYTSPHLQSIRERFLLCGLGDDEPTDRYIDPEEFAETYAYLDPFIRAVENERGEPMTYFEITTALGFEWMGDAAVAAGVFEAGMGGRWDATNMIEGQVAILTRIAVDHIKFLGDTPLSNAEEKVGIIKEGATVVSATQDPDVTDLIAKTVADRGGDLLVLGRDFKILADLPAMGGRLVSLEGRHGTYGELSLPLFGSHQARNLALGLVACEAFLGRSLDPGLLQLAISSVTSPGRLEVVDSDPLVVIDGAHNPDAARALGPALQESFGSIDTTLVATILEDKDQRGILEALLSFADRVIFTRTNFGPRPAADPRELARLAKNLGTDSEVIPSMPEAIEAAVSTTLDDGMVVIAGSLYGVGEARRHLVGEIA